MYQFYHEATSNHRSESLNSSEEDYQSFIACYPTVEHLNQEMKRLSLSKGSFNRIFNVINQARAFKIVNTNTYKLLLDVISKSSSPSSNYALNIYSEYQSYNYPDNNEIFESLVTIVMKEKHLSRKTAIRRLHSKLFQNGLLTPEFHNKIELENQNSSSHYDQNNNKMHHNQPSIGETKTVIRNQILPNQNSAKSLQNIFEKQQSNYVNNVYDASSFACKATPNRLQHVPYLAQLINSYNSNQAIPQHPNVAIPQPSSGGLFTHIPNFNEEGNPITPGLITHQPLQNS